MLTARALLLPLALLTTSAAWAQDSARTDTDQAQASQMLRVFLDCSQCDFNNLRQDITFINYVRDRKDADVHVLVTTQGTGGGGREYTFEFIGLGRFVDIQQRLIYTTSGTDTDDERRRGVARTFSLGLTPYLLRTPSADQFSLQYRAPAGAAQAALTPDDPWNFWILRVGANVDLSGEEKQQSRRFRGNLSANRTTADWKFSVSTNSAVNESDFILSDGREVRSTTRSWDVTGSAIKSIGVDHWGGLLRGQVRSSTQSNERRDARLSVGLEYDFFSYAESTRRSMVIQYSMGVAHVDYYQLTLFGKTKETLGDQRLAAILALRQPWGTSQMSVAYSSYLNDASQYRFDAYGDVDVRLFRGFGLTVEARASRVRDQLYLPAGSATDEEVLLRIRQLATGYRYGFQVGFSYQFGSIYNNVVNPRWSATAR
ncbi:MAG TPA: hypothetical protein VMM93_02420 [Vicinamibacterales bacterium]|nr:hypothetical protein [Vicinamibacterales bacterium]